LVSENSPITKGELVPNKEVRKKQTFPFGSNLGLPAFSLREMTPEVCSHSTAPSGPVFAQKTLARRLEMVFPGGRFIVNGLPPNVESSRNRPTQTELPSALVATPSGIALDR
jgi:hypothetical protein